MMKYIATTLIVIWFSGAFAQVDVSLATSQEVEICGEDGFLDVQLANSSGQLLDSGKLTLTLAKASELSDTGQLSQLNGITSWKQLSARKFEFDLTALPATDTIDFKLNFKVLQEAIGLQNSGMVFRHKVEVEFGSINVSKQSPSYNILYPVILLTGSTNASTAESGQTTTHSFELLNSGYGSLAEFELSLNFDTTNLSLDSASVGRLVGNKLLLTASDFSAIGNSDSTFDRYERLNVQVHYTTFTCADYTTVASYNASWGCEAGKVESAGLKVNQPLTFRKPNLKIKTEASFNDCFSNGGLSDQKIILINSGDGLATNPILRINTANDLTAIDTTSLRISASTGSLNYTIVGRSTSALNSICNSANSVRWIDVKVDNIPPGDTAIINWQMQVCSGSACGSNNYGGWNTRVDYADNCQGNSYSASANGQSSKSAAISFICESPAEIFSGESMRYIYTITSFKNTAFKSNTAEYAATIYTESGYQVDSIRIKTDNQIWSPKSFVWNSSTFEARAIWPADAPFTLKRSEVEVFISAQCGSSGYKNVSLEFGLRPDSTCTGADFLAMNCPSASQTYLHCPSGNCSGITIQSQSLKRISTGLPDNNLDGLADTSGNLDQSKIRLDRAMVGDTIQLQIAAQIVDSFWTNSFAEISVTNGEYITPISSSLNFVSSANGSSSSYNIEPSYSTSGSSISISLDMSADSLTSGHQYQKYDELTITLYCVVNDLSFTFKEASFETELSVSNGSISNNSVKHSCLNRVNKISLFGYHLRNDGKSTISVTECSKTINQHFGFRIGPGSLGYAGSNIFPFEYRNWANIGWAKVKIPTGYDLENTTYRFVTTKSTNKTKAYQLTIEPDTIIQGYSWFHLGKIRQSEAWPGSDDSWNGTITLTLAPQCDVKQNNFEEIDWAFTYHKNFGPSKNETSFITYSKPDLIRFTPAKISLTSPQVVQTANKKEVKWRLNVVNETTSKAAFTWINITSPSNFRIDSIVDSKSGSLITKDSLLYKLGDITSRETVPLDIYASLTSCDTTNLSATVGYNCAGYPDNFEEFKCGTISKSLLITQPVTGYQTRISTEVDSNPCSPKINLELEVSNVQAADLYKLKFDITTPDTNTIKVLNGTTDLDYRGSGSSSVNDPHFLDSTYIFSLDTLIGSQTSVPGVFEMPKNETRVQTTLELGNNFVPGDFILVRITSEDGCSEQLPEINLAYDPNSKFDKDQTSGLHLDIGNSWSASWGDYDNDGYDDLFIPTNDLGKSSLLYHNDGDGTFTKVANTAITAKKTSAISGTWGDYDNDGYIDLFVTNNIGGKNQLFHNNGQGGFDEIKNSPIVDMGIYSHAAAWADYNLDGYLDLVVSDFHPTNFNFLFISDGKGGFEADTKSDVGLSARSSVGVSWADYDNDGDPDLFIANTNNEANQLFENVNGRLIEVKDNNPIVQDKANSMGGTWGDYDNDGDLDLYVTNNSAYQANALYENLGSGTFKRVTQTAVTAFKMNSHGASWIDYDNDGDVDLIVANDQGQKNMLFSNNGNKTFTSIENAITFDRNDSYGTAWSDFDRDGDYDLLITNRGNKTNDFFINAKASCTNHIAFDLRGCQSNKSGIGAKVRVLATIDGSPKWQTLEVSSQTSALGGQNSSTLLFGLKNATVVDSAVITWPSGIVMTMDSLSINRIHIIQENCGATVSGVVYHDANQNGTRDSSEFGIPNVEIRVGPRNIKVFTNSTGEYQFYAITGNYEIMQVLDSNWAQVSPGNDSSRFVSVDLQDGVNYPNQNFGNKSICTYPDLSLKLGTTAFRRGLTNDLNVSLLNEGAYRTQGKPTIEITVSDDVYLVDSFLQLTYDSVGHRVYSFDATNLAPLTDTVFVLTDSVDAYANIDDTVFVNARIVYGYNECSYNNNSVSVEDIIVGSIDPNDKQVFSRHGDATGVINVTDRIHYKIRFQNVGNYAARIVDIIDTLSPDLDWNSIELESTSHPFNFSLQNGVMRWINERIELPDSATDLEGSMGYVSFSIAPRPGIDAFTTIYNDAAIRFDRSEPIITNNTEVVVANEEILKPEPHAVLYPNPSTSYTDIVVAGADAKPIKMSAVNVYNTEGQNLASYNINSYKHRLSTLSLTEGVFIVRVETVDGGVYAARLVVAHQSITIQR